MKDQNEKLKTSSPVRQKSILDKDAASPLKRMDSLGSSNKLNQPKFDEEPNQPLFSKNELAKNELTKSKSSKLDGESSLLQVATKMKDQNEKLKTQLKDLKATLRDTLIKVQIRNAQAEKSVDSRDDVLKQELSENQKQIGQYKKEIQGMKNRLEAFHNHDKMTKMENTLKDKNRQIDELTSEKRNLEKIKLNQDHELDKYQKEFGYEKKIHAYGEESKQLREKIKKTLGVIRGNEKIFQQQQEYLVSLSNQYRMICDKLGLPPSMNFTRAEELSNIMTKKQKDAKDRQDEISSFKTTAAAQQQSSKSKLEKDKSPKEAKESKNLEPTQENIAKLEASIESLQAKTVTLEKDYAKEIATAQNEKQEAANKLKELQAKLKDKEKEASILNHRVSELKRNVRFNALRPLNNEEPVKIAV